MERHVRFLRESFFAAYGFSSLGALNDSVRRWVEEIASTRPWPDDPSRTVAQVFADDERARLLALPQHRLDTSDRTTVSSEKTLWIRFDRNDYSIPCGFRRKPARDSEVKAATHSEVKAATVPR
ncbi:MAG TPA: hypothetical protein VHR45_22780 [Thermoanaerobaculia bacterium]|nr:hypothetical protein [Thermoanaerobaculia bacterium]